MLRKGFFESAKLICTYFLFFPLLGILVPLNNVDF